MLGIINIINLSDFPAKITLEEEKQGINYLKNNGYSISKYDFNNESNNIKYFNELLGNGDNEIILFSSGGINGINNLKSISNDIGLGNKILLGFSDTLHIQGLFHEYDNVYNIYGITLRNIFELSNFENKLLSKYIKTLEFSTELNIYRQEFKEINGTIYGGHLMIYVNLLLILNINDFKGNILFLEFHGMEEYYIRYYLDILKAKGIFDKISGIIIEENNEVAKKYFLEEGIKNLYSLKNLRFIPLYNNVTIKEGKLIMTK